MSRESIVIVDDEQSTLDLCVRILRGSYDVITSTSPHEAQALAAGKNIAVALVDQRMPEMSGREFLVSFSQAHPHASRVAMTGFTEMGDIAALINEGRIHGFVLKPWNNQQMRVIIDREVENFRRSSTIAALHEQLAREHEDMLGLLRDLDNEFKVPHSNNELKDMKNRLRQKVTDEVEKLFLERLLEEAGGNVSNAAKMAKINRTFLYRLMKRHGIHENLPEPV